MRPCLPILSLLLAAGLCPAAVTVEPIRQDLARDPALTFGEEITEENQSAVEEGLQFFTIFLTIFAGGYLYVGFSSLWVLYKQHQNVNDDLTQTQAETASV